MRGIALCLVAGMLSMMCMAAEVKLDYRQREAVKRQVWNMTDIEKKLPAVSDVNGAQILLNRLDAVLADLDKNKCPDENAEVKALKDRVTAARTTLAVTTGSVQDAAHDAAKEATERATQEAAAKAAKAEAAPASSRMSALTSKLPFSKGNAAKDASASASSSSASSGAPAPAAAAPKLNYQQQKDYRDGVSYLNEVTRMAGDVAKFAAVLEKRGLETKSCTSGTLKSVNGEIVSAMTKVGNVENRLKNLPAAHPDVAKLTTDTATQKAILEKASTLVAEYLPQFQAREAAASAAAAATFPADLQKMKALNYGYRMPSFKQDPEAAARLWDDLDENVAWANGAMQTYANFSQATTFAMQYKPMVTAAPEYRKKAESYAVEAEKNALAQLKRAEDMAAKAVSERKPAFFTGGVRQCQQEAEKSYRFLRAAKNCQPQADAVQKEMTRVEAALAEQYKKLEVDIIAATPMPQNSYTGQDKDQLETMIRDAWKKAWPKEEILAVRFSGDWQRKESAQWDAGSKSWSFTDTSVLPIRMVVRENNDTALIYMAYINKNNQTGSMNTGVQTRSGGYVVEKMLVKNIK